MVDTWLGPTFCNTLPLSFPTCTRILSSSFSSSSSSMATSPSQQHHHHHRRCYSNPNPPHPHPQPALLVFSGGTAFNGVVEELKNFTTRIAHVLPISDDGGRTAEIVRVLSVLRCVKLIIMITSVSTFGNFCGTKFRGRGIRDFD